MFFLESHGVGWLQADRRHEAFWYESKVLSVKGWGSCRMTTVGGRAAVSEHVTEHEGMGSLQDGRDVARCGVWVPS